MPVANPVSSAGSRIGRKHVAEGLPAVRTQAGGSLLQFGIEVFEDRLHRTHDERQADEDQRHQYAERREGNL